MGRIIAALSLLAFLACAQVAPPAVFEVASVRVNQTGNRGGSMDFSRGGERFTATNVSLGALVLTAYNLTVRQLSGPARFPSESYDIVAKADHRVSRDEMLRMLQSLLVERFQLVVHRETKEVAVYALTLARSGPKLHRSDRPRDEFPSPRTPLRAGGVEPRSGHLIFKEESMPDLAWALSRMSGIGDRVVVDDTGLHGNYDFELTFEPNRAPPPGGDVRDPASRLDDISAALEEQLGLKLLSKKAPVEFLVIDHVGRLSGN